MATKVQASEDKAAAKETAATAAPAAEKTDDAPTAVAVIEKPAGKILCLAARDISDELAGQMLAVLLMAEGYTVEVLAAREATGRDTVKETATRETVTEQPRMIWISALPPLADARVRELCRLWTQRHPRAVINAGLWRETLHPRSTGLLKRAGAHELATTLREAVTITNQLLKPVKSEQPTIEAVNPTTLSDSATTKVASLAS